MRPSTNAPCYYRVDHDMRVTEIAVTVAVAIIFLRLHERWKEIVSHHKMWAF
jgi:hypothetical protein